MTGVSILMRRIAVLAAIGLVVVFTFGVLAAETDDADAPDWLHPLIDDGRASLLEHLDLVEPGSPLRFTDARCRSDGTVALFYEARWLWVMKLRAYAQASPPYGGSSGFSGGFLQGSVEEDLELRDAVWLAEHVQVSCDRPVIGTAPCRGDGYVVTAPSGWWIHPPDASRSIGPCSLFAQEAFLAGPAGEGAQIRLWAGEGCRGSFDRVVAQHPIEIDGFTAVRAEVVDGHGGMHPATVYDVTLSATLPCETSRWLSARTEADDPGSYEENQRLLDEVMQSLRFDR